MSDLMFVCLTWGGCAVLVLCVLGYMIGWRTVWEWLCRQLNRLSEVDS